MLVRTFRFTSTNAEPVRNVTTMNLMAGEWQAAGVTLVRTSDVARVDDVLFVGGEYRYADASKESVPFTWTIRLATDGTRIASIHETFH